MKFRSAHSVVRALRRGFTLIEMLLAAAVGVLLAGAIVSLGTFTARSFFMMGNYVDLDAQSRHAVDVLGRKIRNASSLVGFSTNNPMSLEFYNATSNTTVTVAYYTNNSTLMMTNVEDATGFTTVQMLLTNCDQWHFTLYDRYPNTAGLTFYSATNSAGQWDTNFCKVINMSWKCSRSMLGTKFNTESVQTAQISLRNKMAE